MDHYKGGKSYLKTTTTKKKTPFLPVFQGLGTGIGIGAWNSEIFFIARTIDFLHSIYAKNKKKKKSLHHRINYTLW